MWQRSKLLKVFQKNKIMKRKTKVFLIGLSVLVLAIVVYKMTLKVNLNTKYFVGQKLDSLNGVYVFYNGGVAHTGERNLGADGYNIGLKYQCVEFVNGITINFTITKCQTPMETPKIFLILKFQMGK